MNKKFFSLLIFLILISFNTSQVNAVYVSPSTGNKLIGGEETIKVYASPVSTGDTVVRLKLNLQNATVLDFTTALLPFGTCYPSGSTDNSTDVCVDLVKTSGDPFNQGDELGSIRVKWGSAGTATITRLSGNGYYNGVTLTEQTGVAGTYVVGNIPSTSLELPIDSRIVLIAFGAITIFFAFYLKNNLKTINEKE